MPSDNKTYDLSPNCCCVCMDAVNPDHFCQDGCPTYSITLTLEEDQIQLKSAKVCGKGDEKTYTYEDFKGVKTAKNCGCYQAIMAEGTFANEPGCGCNKAYCDEVVADIHKRQAAKGISMERD